MISFHLALRGTVIAGHCWAPVEMLWEVQGSYCWFCFAWLETYLSQLLCLGKRMKLRSEITCSVNEIFANGIALPKQPYQRAMWCQEQQIFLHKLMGRGGKKKKHQMLSVLAFCGSSWAFWRIRINKGKLSQKGESLLESKLWIGSKYKQLFTFSHLSALCFEEFIFHSFAQQKIAFH